MNIRFLILIVCANFINGSTWAAEPRLNPELLEIAKKDIALYGEHISVQNQEAILQQKILLGMNPYEARLAGGAYFFKVQADPSVWPAGADPNRVINAQAIKPDASKIWLTFQNATQFPDSDSPTSQFRVYFEHGRAINIEKTM